MTKVHKFTAFLRSLGLVVAVIGAGCNEKANHGQSGGVHLEPSSVRLIPNKGINEVGFGDERQVVKKKMGKPSFEHGPLLSYTNIGVDVWLSKKNDKVIRITAGSFESIQEAQRFQGHISSLKIGSTCEDVITKLGQPDVVDQQKNIDSSASDEVFIYFKLGMQVNFREKQAILFTLENSGRVPNKK